MQVDFLGNETIRGQLATLGLSGRLHHCLLFEGVEGVGKATTARWLSRLVNCELDAQEARPCGECWSCRMIPEGRHPDIIELGPDPEKVAGVISVSQARELLSQLSMRPHSARQRMIIISPADAMTTEAGNALLKTLEEPPRDTQFILVSARPARLLATVRSRCQRIRFGPVSDDEISAWLSRLGHPASEGVLQEAGGGPGRALRLSQKGEASRQQSRQDFLGAVSGGMDELLAYGETLTKGPRAQWAPRMEASLQIAEGMVRDLVIVLSNSSQGLCHASERARLRAWADVLGYPGVVGLSSAIAAARADLAANVNGRLVMDTLLTRWARELGATRRVEG